MKADQDVGMMGGEGGGGQDGPGVKAGPGAGGGEELCKQWVK
jgi:hypothetical protein